jgi:hypothetical protein
MREAFISFANGTFGAAWFNTTCAAAMREAFITFIFGTFGATWFNTSFDDSWH